MISPGGRIALVASLLGGCPPPTSSIESSEGVALRALRGARVRWLLSSGSVEVEAEGPSPRAGMHAGHLRRVSLRGDPAPRLRHLAFGLEVDGRVREMKDVDVRAVTRSGRPVLRISGTVEASGRSFRLANEIHVHPTSPVVTIRSRVRQTRGRRTLAKVVDVVDWGGVPAFVPGVGLVATELRLDAPWIARAGLRSPYAFVPRHPPLGVWLRTEPHGPADLVLRGSAGDLHERRIVLAPRTLAEVAARAWSVAGAAHRTIEGSVIGPLQGMQVVAAGEEGGVEAVATPDAQGSFALVVRPGRYRVIAEGSAGGSETNADATVSDARTVLDIPDGGRLQIDVREHGGDLVPARAVILGVDPTPWPDLGPDYRADGAQHSICLSDGPVELPLRPGRYRVTATRGPEWSIETRDVAVPAGRTTRLALTLRREVETPGLVAGDFHVHASPSSDSLVSIPDRVRSLLCEGVEVAVPTDHNHVTDYAPAISALGAGASLATAPGVEITSGGPYFGHFNAFPVDRSWGPMPFPFIETSPRAIFAAVRERYPQAVVQVNHPRMGGIGYFELAGLDPRAGRAREGFWSPDFDAIEVWNGLDLHRMDRVEQNLQDWMALLASGLRYTALGNSDSHRIHWQWVGYPRSYLRVENDDPRAVDAGQISRAIKGGRVFVTSGPILDLEVDGAGPGETVRRQGGSVTVRVRVQAASWVDTKEVQLVVGGEVRETWTVRDREAAGLRGEWTAQIPIDRPTFVLAIVRGERAPTEIQPGRSGPPMAFTNPVFIE